MQTDPPAGVSASPIADNVMTWYDSAHCSPARDTLDVLLHVTVAQAPAEEHFGFAQPLTARRNAVIIGPADTPFEDGTFRLVMHFEEAYPNKPPSVKFISTMFHPNVYGTGELCLDILQNRWSPTYDVAAVLTSIQRYAPR